MRAPLRPLPQPQAANATRGYSLPLSASGKKASGASTTSPHFRKTPPVSSASAPRTPTVAPPIPPMPLGLGMGVGASNKRQRTEAIGALFGEDEMIDFQENEPIVDDARPNKITKR